MTNTDLENALEVMIGSQEAEAMYIGDNLIWEKESLPYDAEIEYLQSSGTQYIDTGIIPDSDTGIYLKASQSGDDDNYAVGLRNDNGNTRWSIGRSGYGWYWGYGTYDST